jgi:hypothetical protein
LLVQDPMRPIRATDRLRAPREVCLIGNQIPVRFRIREDDVFVFNIDLPERAEKISQVDLSPPDASRYEVQRVHADAQSAHLRGSRIQALIGHRKIFLGNLKRRIKGKSLQVLLFRACVVVRSRIYIPAVYVCRSEV